MNTQHLSSSNFARTCRRLLVVLCIVAAGAAQHAFGQSISITNIWSVQAQSNRTYLNATNDSDRGIAYNPFTSHAYVVTRNGGLQVAILSADDGSLVGNLSVLGITGGDFALNQIGVADDGSIYAANLTTSTTARQFRIYRWADEGASPTLVYAENPTPGRTLRFGDAIDVRGGGTNTEIIASCGGTAATNLVVVFRPLDASLGAFTNRPIIVPRSLNINVNDFAKGVTFGRGNTFFAKNNGASTTAKLCSYDWNTGAGAWIRNYAINGSIASIDYDAVNDLLAGVLIGSASAQHALLVYDVSDDGASLIYSNNFPAPLQANGNAVNGVNIYSNRIVAVEPRNGAQMAGVHLSTNLVPPGFTQQPGAFTIVQGGFSSIAVNATGSKPRSYRWLFNGTEMPGETNRTLVFTNVTPAMAGGYSVVVSNAAGVTNSNEGVLTVTPAVLGNVLVPLWRIEPGHPSYPWLLTDNNARGMAYNPATDHLIVCSRTGSNALYVLDAKTGEYLRSLNVTGGIVTNVPPVGTFVINMVACSADGQVFAGNLTTDGAGTGSGQGPFKLYRWADDSASAVPEVVWAGDPGNGIHERWGDTLDIRGTGAGVEVLLGGRNSNIVAYITGVGPAPFLPADTITVADAPNAAFGLGIAFGNGSTFWGKSSGTNTALRHVQFDVGTGAGTILFADANYPASAPLGFDPRRNLLGAVSIETPDNFRLFEYTGTSLVPLDTEFVSDFANANGAGSVRFGRDHVFVLDGNNGIAAYGIPPKLRMTRNGGTIELNWDGLYYLQFATEAARPYTNLVDEPPHVFTPATEASPRGFFRLAPFP